MRIKDIPWWNRPGYKLKKDKPLNEAELLAIILERGNESDQSSIDLANKLLKKHNFHKLTELSLNELKKEVGEIKALKLRAMFDLFNKTSRLQRNGFKPTIECAKDVYNYFVDELKDKKKEYFYALLLDSKNRIIKEELVSVGTLNSSLVHPREVFKEAIKNSANAIILVHNHPSDDYSFSEEDEMLTEKLDEASRLLKIKLLDHVIITKDKYYSFKENGKISPEVSLNL